MEFTMEGIVNLLRVLIAIDPRKWNDGFDKQEADGYIL
jgi:hypothetical protein